MTVIYAVFFFVSLVNLYAVKKGNKIGRYVTKPLLMPLLILLYLFSVKDPNILIILALFFGFLGDTFLMLTKRKIKYLGVLSFLLGHLFYIIVFWENILIEQISFSYIIIGILYIFYGIFIYKKLKPDINIEKLGIILYIIVILFMSYSSFLYLLLKSGLGTYFCFLGSILFIISDTILAFNDFKAQIKNGDLYIMSTYILAQLFIIIGFINLEL